MSDTSSEKGTKFRLVTLGVPRMDVIEGASGSARSTGPGKSLALITYLAFAPRRTASRDSLCDLLWSHRSLEQSRPLLRQTLWLIKTEISRDLIAASADSVSLATHILRDTEEFTCAIESDDLTRAISLYNGDFFSDYGAPGAGRFEEWANSERTRFRSLFIRSAETLARRALDTGHFADAVALARRIRTADPNGQLGWRLLIESTIASGDSIGAKADADQFEEWLRTEEWEPEPATIETLKAARKATTQKGDREEFVDLVAELVGREREFSEIHNSWNSARTKGACVVHIIAESGMGKTRLVRDITARIQASHARARYVRANHAERDIPFTFAAAVAETVGALRGSGGIAPVSVRTLVSLSPSLSSRFPDSVESSDRLDPLRVGLALLDLVAAVANESPVALALDDLHWCDAASREALTVVASRLSSENVLLLSTSRPHYAAGPLRSDSAELRLARLNEPEITELVTSLGRLPEAAWGKALPGLLLQASGGSPLGILEGIRMSIDSGLLVLRNEVWTSPDPGALLATLRKAETIKRRVAALSDLEKHVLLLTAIAGAPIPQQFVVAAAQLDAVDARRALANLEQRGFIVTDGDTISAAHDAIAETVIAQSSEESRTMVSAELGAVMSVNDVTHWRLRAIPHLVEAKLYSKAAAVAAPILRSTARRSSHVDARLSGMLGSARAHDAVRKVKSALPLTVKRPLLMRQLGAAALLLIAGGGAFAAKRFWKPGPTPTQLVVLTQTPEGDTEVRKANLDLDHWDPAMPLSFSSTFRLHGWVDMLRSHITPRPGTESWAVYAIYPDSGEGDIDLVDLDRHRTRLTSSRHDDRPMQFSPDGQELLFLTTRWSRNGWSDVAVLDMRTRQVRRISSGDQKHDAPHWSPDGTRIAYNKGPLDRAKTTICVADADGSHTQCRSVAGWSSIGQIGWIDAHRLVVMHDGAGAAGSVSIYNVDKGTAETSQLPRRAELLVNPDGEWTIVSQQAEGVREIKLAPTTRFDLARVVTEDSNTARFVLFATPGLSNRFVDSLAIERGQEPLPPNVPILLTATAWSKQRRKIQPAVARWRSLTPSIATVDSLGVLVASDTGSVVIELSAGGWRHVLDTVQIGSSGSRTVLDERWGAGWRGAWRSFGDPVPIVVNDSGRTALLNNGDGNFFSGVYYRHTFDAGGGVAMDIDLSTPITRTQWQIIQPGLQPFSNVNHVERWDHKTGYLSGFLDDAPGCFLSYPAGEGEDALTGMPWYRSMRNVMNDASFKLDDGRWYHVRLQIFPSGRCGVAINGHAVIISPGLGPLRQPVLPIIQGSTVDTRILVGRVVIRSGIPNDVDWTKLEFDGFNWIRR